MTDDRAFPKWAALYLKAQVAGVIVWWFLILRYPAAREPFFRSDDYKMFVLADLVVYALLGSAAAAGVSKDRDWARPALCVLAGGGLYATALDVSYAVQTGVGWLGPALMLPTVIVPGYLCWRTLK